jgi:hypothetical protein
MSRRQAARGRARARKKLKQHALRLRWLPIDINPPCVCNRQELPANNGAALNRRGKAVGGGGATAADCSGLQQLFVWLHHGGALMTHVNQQCGRRRAQVRAQVRGQVRVHMLACLLAADAGEHRERAHSGWVDTGNVSSMWPCRGSWVWVWVWVNQSSTRST